MNALATARAHLAKSREFLVAANLAHDQELYNAATSNAVLSGINSKDAICLKLTGQTTKSDDHTDAVRELAATGAEGAGRWLPFCDGYWPGSRSPSTRPRT